MQGFIPPALCFIILSNYLHRFAHQASVHSHDVIAPAINQETFWGISRASPPSIPAHREAGLMFLLIHSDVLMLDAPSLPLDASVAATLISLVAALFDNVCLRLCLIMPGRGSSEAPLQKENTLHMWLGYRWVMHYGCSHSCLPRSRSTLCLNDAPALVNIQLLAPSASSPMCVQKPKTCRIVPAAEHHIFPSAGLLF